MKTACLALLFLVTPTLAADLQLSVEVPRLDVAEYHRPYVAAWIESADGRVVGDLAVWYQQPAAGKEDGGKWLKDMRQWWRRSGRTQEHPVDGIAGATRPVGRHRISTSDARAPLAGLPAGDYRLQVEAAREVGGRELLTLEFTWPPKAASRKQVQGQHELGQVTLDITP